MKTLTINIRMILFGLLCALFSSGWSRIEPVPPRTFYLVKAPIGECSSPLELPIKYTYGDSTLEKRDFDQLVCKGFDQYTLVRTVKANGRNGKLDHLGGYYASIVHEGSACTLRIVYDEDAKQTGARDTESQSNMESFLSLLLRELKVKAVAPHQTPIKIGATGNFLKWCGKAQR